MDRNISKYLNIIHNTNSWKTSNLSAIFGNCKCYFVTCLALALYGYLLLPNDKLSFDIIGANVTTIIQPTQTETIRYIPLIGFSIISFFGSYGVTSIPNLLNAEVFSLK